jgi:predicted negative regulator of RcsB-dependent stress response
MSGKSKSQPEETPSPIGEISQEPSALESFLDANQKKLVMIGILVILILVGYVVYDGIREMNIRDDAALVASSKTVPDLEKTSQALEGTTAGGSALLLKTQLLWQDQQPQEAVTALEDFISKYPEHPAIGSAYTRLGSYQQQLEKITEAKEAYNKAVETKSAASPLALLALGDLAREDGNDDEAKAFYERIVSEYETKFQVKTLARQRLDMIGVKPPVEKQPEPTKKPDAATPPVNVPGNTPATPGKPNPTQPTPPAEKPAETPKPAEEPKPSPAPAPTPTGEPEPTPEEGPAPTPAEEAASTPAETPRPEPTPAPAPEPEPSPEPTPEPATEE